MFDTDFINGVLTNEGLTPEQKVQSIIDEHNASERGLVQKRDELLGKEKKLKEQITGYETKGSEYEGKIAELENQLKANNPEERKRYYETQVETLNKNHAAELADLTKERDFYRNSHYEMLKSNAISDGTKDFQFIDGLKDGFIANVMYRNNFEPKDIDGSIIFLNKENKTIQEVMKDFALTTEGKAYLRNPTSGAGSHPTKSTYGTGGKTMTRTEFEKMRTENPASVSAFFAKGGQVID